MERQWSNWTYFQKLWWWIATVFCGFGVGNRVGAALYEVGVPGWFPGTRWELHIDTSVPVMPTSVVDRENPVVNEEAYSAPRWQFSQEKLLKLMVLERQKLDLEMEIKGEKLKGQGAKLRKLEKKLKDTLRELEDTMEEAEEAKEAKEAKEEPDGESLVEEAKEEADGESQVTGEAMEISE
jgi:hypothetical protein